MEVYPDYLIYIDSDAHPALSLIFVQANEQVNIFPCSFVERAGRQAHSIAVRLSKWKILLWTTTGNYPDKDLGSRRARLWQKAAVLITLSFVDFYKFHWPIVI